MKITPEAVVFAVTFAVGCWFWDKIAKKIQRDMKNHGKCPQCFAPTAPWGKEGLQCTNMRCDWTDKK